jgi:hypothetical protein
VLIEEWPMAFIYAGLSNNEFQGANVIRCNVFYRLRSYYVTVNEVAENG